MDFARNTKYTTSDTYILLIGRDALGEDVGKDTKCDGLENGVEHIVDNEGWWFQMKIKLLYEDKVNNSETVQDDIRIREKSSLNCGGVLKLPYFRYTVS
jgi:hypothetical protein